MNISYASGITNAEPYPKVLIQYSRVQTYTVQISLFSPVLFSSYACSCTNINIKGSVFGHRKWHSRPRTYYKAVSQWREAGITLSCLSLSPKNRKKTAVQKGCLLSRLLRFRGLRLRGIVAHAPRLPDAGGTSAWLAEGTPLATRVQPPPITHGLLVCQVYPPTV